MTTQEFSEQFDTLYNQQYYMMFSVQNPLALDEYEKSVFLTKAQEKVVETLYRAGYGIPEGFEKTEYARRMLQQLVLNTEGLLMNDSSQFTGDIQVYAEHIVPQIRTTEDSYIFFLADHYASVNNPYPLGYYGIIYEQATFGGDDPCAAGKIADIVPVKHDELHRILRNPFRGASIRRVLRVDHSGEMLNPNSSLQDDNNVGQVLRVFGAYPVELISKYPIAKYFARVIRKPFPIILVSLDDDDSPSIEGFKDKMECELNPAIHMTILEEAVRLALASKSLNTVPTAQQPTEQKGKEESGE